MPILAIGIGILAMSFKPSFKSNQIITGSKVYSSFTAKQIKQQNRPMVTAAAVAFVRAATPEVADAVVEACPELLVAAAALAQPTAKASLASMNEDKFNELLSKSEELDLDAK